MQPRPGPQPAFYYSTTITPPRPPMRNVRGRRPMHIQTPVGPPLRRSSSTPNVIRQRALPPRRLSRGRGLGPRGPLRQSPMRGPPRGLPPGRVFRGRFPPRGTRGMRHLQQKPRQLPQDPPRMMRQYSSLSSTVSPAPNGAPSNLPARVLVRNVGPSVTREQFSEFLSSKCGEAGEFKWKQDQKYIFVTFSNPEIAARAIGLPEHERKLGSQTITIFKVGGSASTTAPSTPLKRSISQMSGDPSLPSAKKLKLNPSQNTPNMRPNEYPRRFLHGPPSQLPYRGRVRLGPTDPSIPMRSLRSAPYMRDLATRALDMPGMRGDSVRHFRDIGDVFGNGMSRGLPHRSVLPVSHKILEERSLTRRATVPVGSRFRPDIQDKRMKIPEPRECSKEMRAMLDDAEKSDREMWVCVEGREDWNKAVDCNAKVCRNIVKFIEDKSYILRTKRINSLMNELSDLYVEREIAKKKLEAMRKFPID